MMEWIIGTPGLTHAQLQFFSIAQEVHPPPPHTTDTCTHWVLKPKVQHPSNVVRAERGQQSARTTWD